MLDVHLKVTYADGVEKVVKVRPHDQIAFETRFDESILSAFGPKARVTHIYFLAWSAVDAAAPFEDWVKTVAGAEPTQVEPVDPTNPEDSAGG